MLPQILHWSMTKTPTSHPLLETEPRVRAGGVAQFEKTARGSTHGYMTISVSCTNVTFA
jgi:hypothetical protein